MMDSAISLFMYSNVWHQATLSVKYMLSNVVVQSARFFCELELASDNLKKILY